MGISRIYLWPSFRRRPRLLPPPHQFPCIEFRLMSATGETRFRSARPESRYCVPTVFYFPSATSHIQSVPHSYVLARREWRPLNILLRIFLPNNILTHPTRKLLAKHWLRFGRHFFEYKLIHHTRSCWLITPISLDLVTTAAVVVVVIYRLRPAQ